MGKQNSVVILSIRHDMDDDEWNEFLESLKNWILRNSPVTTEEEDVLIQPK